LLFGKTGSTGFSTVHLFGKYWFSRTLNRTLNRFLSGGKQVQPVFALFTFFLPVCSVSQKAVRSFLKNRFNRFWDRFNRFLGRKVKNG
jgi:hypothetical protein